MGILRNRIPEPPGFNEVDDSDPVDRSIVFDGIQYDCHEVYSPDNHWSVAYGRARDGTNSSVFLFENGTLRHQTYADRPTKGVVSNEGTSLVYDSRDSLTIGGDVLAYSADGRELLSYSFDLNISKLAINPSGTFASVVTRGNSSETIIFDVDSGAIHTRFSLTHGDETMLGFANDGEYLYFRRGPHTPYFGINLAGEVVWKSKPYRSTEPLITKLRRLFRGN